MTPTTDASLVDHRGTEVPQRRGAHPLSRRGARAPQTPGPDARPNARTDRLPGERGALAIRACDVDLAAAELPDRDAQAPAEPHWRAVPVPEDLIHALELVHRLRSAQASARGAKRRALWPITRQSANRQVGALMRSAGIEGPQACPRGLRHSFGVAAVEAGVPLPTIAAMLGHASLNTTAIYTTAVGAQARELVARMWG